MLLHRHQQIWYPKNSGCACQPETLIQHVIQPAALGTATHHRLHAIKAWDLKQIFSPSLNSSKEVSCPQGVIKLLSVNSLYRKKGFLETIKWLKQFYTLIFHQNLQMNIFFCMTWKNIHSPILFHVLLVTGSFPALVTIQLIFYHIALVYVIKKLWRGIC